MVLEATMICLDNSESLRNGDFAPTRFQAQLDSINLVCGLKTQANPENTVGVLTMAGRSASVVVTPTADLGKILTALHGLPVEGSLNMTGLQVAQLALKHRQNKNQRQRIVFFAGSPIALEQAALVKMGKKLKKNNVAVDVVNFGDVDDNVEKLTAFIAAVNSNDNSHLLTVPAGGDVGLSDLLVASPIMQGEEGTSAFAASAAAGAAMAAAGGGGGDMDFGIDANIDPELALALRVSMEEERARQEAAGGDGGDGAGAGDDAAAAVPAGGDFAVPMDDDDALLQQALQMSMMAEQGGGAAAAPAAAAPAAPAAEEDPDLAAAMAMSMDPPAGPSGGAAAGGDDQAFLADVLQGLPGVDVSDPAVQAALQAANKDAEDKKE